jgi:hypothetical protein
MAGVFAEVPTLFHIDVNFVGRIESLRTFSAIDGFVLVLSDASPKHMFGQRTQRGPERRLERRHSHVAPVNQRLR